MAILLAGAVAVLPHRRALLRSGWGQNLAILRQATTGRFRDVALTRPLRGLRPRRVLRRGLRRRRPVPRRTTRPCWPGSTGFTPRRPDRARARCATPPSAAPGITFTVYGEGEGIERTFPMDLRAPHHPGRRVGPHRGAASSQRVTALNRFLDDLYVGERAAINDGIVPTLARSTRPTGF